jgi:hypothetical protein
MPKKLTKHQRQYRKRKKDSQRDFRRVEKDGPWDGVRVTRKRLKVWVSQEAYERLNTLAADAGIHNWEMLSRMILQSLPRYASMSDSDSPTKRYEWPERLLNPTERSVRNKGSKGDRQISYDITSTAWKKLECHKTAIRLSKARIVQALILNYKPLTPEQLERQRWKREEDARERDDNLETRRPYKEYKSHHLLDTGGGVIIHIKGIPAEYWEPKEWDEYVVLMEQYYDRTLRGLIAYGKEDSSEYAFILKQKQQWDAAKVAYQSLGETPEQN